MLRTVNGADIILCSTGQIQTYDDQDRDYSEDVVDDDATEMMVDVEILFSPEVGEESGD